MKYKISNARTFSRALTSLGRVFLTVPATAASAAFSGLLSPVFRHSHYAFLLVRGRSVLLLAGLCFAATVVLGQKVPRLEYTSIDRTTSARVSTVAEYNQDEVADTTQGAFAQATAANLTTYSGSGSARSSHRSKITDLGIHLKFDVSYQGTADEWSHDFTARSALSATFQVTEPVTAVLDGSIEFHGESGAGVQVVLFGAGVNRLFDDNDLGGEPVPISENLDLEPGFTYLFSVTALVDESIFDASSEGTVHLELALDIGDEDFDGLPDKWEEDGIDGNGDGMTDIDLPAYGADPRHKDLFVEVDVQTGSEFPLEELSRVVDAFADAPLSNPDGSDGITLHPIIDELDLPALTYVYPPVDEVAAQKAVYFGTVEQRNDPDWEQGIRELKQRSFRYCIIGGMYLGTSGWGEIPGDDFIVTVEGIKRERYSVNDLMAVFMHELGHTLGLRHGGGDPILDKPNYYSIMNYLFTYETALKNKVTWELDYSRARLFHQNEAALDEQRGFGGPSPYYDDKLTLYNKVPGQDSTRIVKAPLRTGVPVDFNGNGRIDTDPVAVDINRQYDDREASPDQILRGYNDWENISLGFQEGDNFGNGPSMGLTTSSPEVIELTDEIYDDLLELYSGIPEATSVQKDKERSSSNVRFSIPSPNPVTGQVRLTYAIPTQAEVYLAVYDLLGRRVATLIYTSQAAGHYATSWDTRTGTGKLLASGKYFAVLRVQGSGINEQITQPFIILR